MTFFSHWHSPNPHLHSFPTRRSSDLFNAAGFTAKMTATADAYRQSVPQKKEQVEQQSEADKPKPDEEQAAKQGQQQFRSEEHTSELQSRRDLVCRLLLEKKKTEKDKK